MKLVLDIPGSKKSITLRFIYYGIVALVLAVIKVVLLDLIAVSSITPDLILILVVWIALKEGQFVALFAGFTCGLLFDIVSIDVIGTNALTKTIVGLIAGWFYKENQADFTIGSFRFLGIVFLCSVVHNLVYNVFYIRPSQIDFATFFLKYGLATSLYTTVIAVFPMFIKQRRKGFR
jgi:rod shape-determining protein MreD